MEPETVQESEEIGGWERWHDWQAQVMQPVIDWYVRATEAAPGRRILDAACGTGIPALALAERVGPDGCVVATDVSLEMLAATRRKAAAKRLANVVTREANAAAIGGPDGAYDAVTCKDGLMFCTDIVAAVRELRRVLKPGGRYAFSVWDEPSANPAFAKMLGVLAPYVPGPPPAPDAPGPFRLSAPGELERVIRAAGFTDCTVERVAITFRWESAAQHFQSMSDMVGPLERLVMTLAPEARRRLERDFADAFAAYTSATGILVPGLQICASGTR